MKRKIKILLLICIALIGIAILAKLLFATKKPKDKQSFWEEVKKERVQAKQDTNNIQKIIWYKNSFIYTLDVEVFKDSDGDGVGDIRGLISKLDYIKSLGTDILWLAPFQPTPNLDDGYDITDHYGIDPRLGNMTDFTDLVRETKARNMHLIIDLVFNHTSDKHPWFLKACQGIEPYKSYYVWSNEKPKNEKEGMVFEGVQQEIWSWQPQAKAYYYHRFYNYMPDLDMQNPKVKNEMDKVMDYWLQTGIDGFRIDAVTYLTEIAKTEGSDFEHDYDMLKTMRIKTTSVHPYNFLLGEASVTKDQQPHFFGEHGESLNMIFGFYVDQRIFYAMATEEAESLNEALEQGHDIPAQCSWVYFLRNQDEMGMGKLKEKERQKVYDKFAPSKNMQIYNRGVRRRLAPMLENDPQRLKMAYSMMFALPGIPMIRYGDEIGMGDDLNLQERLAVRTPMQWNDSTSAGFSSARQTVRPIIDSGMYGYPQVNVKKEEGDSLSLLVWIKKLVAIRKAHPAIAYGDWQIMKTGSSKVLAIRYDWNGESIITFHNLSHEPQHLEVGVDATALEDIVTHQKIQSTHQKYDITFQGYGYAWYRLVK